MAIQPKVVQLNRFNSDPNGHVTSLSPGTQNSFTLTLTHTNTHMLKHTTIQAWLAVHTLLQKEIWDISDGSLLVTGNLG